MQKLESGIYVAPTKGKIVIPTREPETFSALPLVEIREVGNGLSTAILPLHEDSMRLLSNMGIPTAGLEPLRYYYRLPLVEGKYPLYEHQIQSAGFLVAHKRGFNLSTMRVGKTASAIAGADYLQKNKQESSTLVVSTVTNMRDVWEKEIKGLLPTARVQVVDGSREQRKEKLGQIADYYIINFDGVKTMFKELHKMVMDGVISIVVIDELSHYANYRSGLWKSLNALINDKRYPIEYVWGLTGTPGKDPEPVYAQVRLICPDRIAMNFTQWKNLTMINTWGYKWVMKQEAPAMIEKVMQPTIRFNKDDIFDIPKPKREYVFSALTKEQERIVDELKRDSMASLKEEDGRSVATIATSRSVAVGKVLQACTGAVKINEDKTVRINIDSRLRDLQKIVDGTKRKVVIFCAFKETIKVLADWFKKNKIGYAESHGGVTGKARAKEIMEFQDEGSDIKVLLAHPRTTAFGTELSIADTMIFFGPPMSGYMAFAQAVERMSSLKQTATELKIVFFYGSAEEKLAFASAEAGEKDGAIINKLFEEMVKEQ